jgi:chromosome segregation ATPase
VQQSIAAVKASFDSKLNTLNQSLTDLKEQIVKLNEKVATQTKNQKLEWAISNAGTNSFKFYTKDNDYSGVESTGFVKTVLLSFRKGLGIT